MAFNFHDGIATAGSELATNDISVSGAATAPIYVGNDGDDADAGTRAKPLLTVAAAVAAAQDGGLIVLLSGYAATISSQITVAVTGLHILGEGGSPGSAPSVELTLDHATANMFLVSGNFVLFENIKFMGSAQATTGKKVRVTGDHFECMGCYFAQAATDTGQGVHLDTGSDFARFSDTYFVSVSETTQPAYGLHMGPASARLTVDRCVFDGGTTGFELATLLIDNTVLLRGRSNSFLRGAGMESAADLGYFGISESSGDSQLFMAW